MIIIFVTWEKYRIVTEEMQWDSTIQPLRMAKNKTKRKRREHKWWQGYKATGLKSCQWECKYNSHLEDWQFLIKSNIPLLYDLAIPLLDWNFPARYESSISFSLLPAFGIIRFLKKILAIIMRYEVTSYYGFNLHFPHNCCMLFSWKVKWKPVVSPLQIFIAVVFVITKNWKQPRYLNWGMDF